MDGFAFEEDSYLMILNDYIEKYGTIAGLQFVQSL